MIDLQQPQPFDLVGDPVQVAGQSVTFEGTIEWRISLGACEATGFFAGGGSVSVRQFQTEIALAALPVSPPLQAFAHLSLFSRSASDDSVIDLQTVTIILGSRLVGGFEGWQPRTVMTGDSLSAIAREVYGSASAWPVLAEANRHIISDPDHIAIGQILRIPVGTPIL